MALLMFFIKGLASVTQSANTHREAEVREMSSIVLSISL